MNRERLKYLYENRLQPEASEVDDLKLLTQDYPYFSMPFEVLSLHYFQTGHYKFDDTLRKAALRVEDRSKLYHFINGTIPVSHPIEMIIEVSTSTTNSFDREYHKLNADAPNTLRMPISLVRCSVMKDVIPKSPRQLIRTARMADVPAKAFVI